jgi:hypothetical protein
VTRQLQFGRLIEKPADSCGLSKLKCQLGCCQQPLRPSRAVWCQRCGQLESAERTGDSASVLRTSGGCLQVCGCGLVRADDRSGAVPSAAVWIGNDLGKRLAGGSSMSVSCALLQRA